MQEVMPSVGWCEGPLGRSNCERSGVNERRSRKWPTLILRIDSHYECEWVRCFAVGACGFVGFSACNESGTRFAVARFVRQQNMSRERRDYHPRREPPSSANHVGVAKAAATANAEMSPAALLTPAEVAQRLKVDHRTVRRLFSNEPGVLVICFPQKGRRLYRTLRIPIDVFQRVVTRLANVA